MGVVRDPEDYAFFDIMDGFEDAEGDTVLLVKEATADEMTAVAIEELFDAFGEVYVFVMPPAAQVEHTTKARIADRAGVNFAALARARQEYRMMLAEPGGGHFKRLGTALDEIWTDC